MYQSHIWQNKKMQINGWQENYVDDEEEEEVEEEANK